MDEWWQEWVAKIVEGEERVSREGGVASGTLTWHLWNHVWRRNRRGGGGGLQSFCKTINVSIHYVFIGLKRLTKSNLSSARLFFHVDAGYQ
jgi:hypothetical protein